MESDQASSPDENPDLDETNARLQSGLIQCHRVIADYRAILGDLENSPDPQQPG